MKSSIKSIFKPSALSFFCALVCANALLLSGGMNGALAAEAPAPAGAPAASAPAVAAGRVFAAEKLPGRRYPARVTAVSEVSVTSRVTGEIIERPYAEGGLVKKGDVLYRLDPVRYEAEAENARGALREAEAEHAYAQASLKRIRDLWQKNAQSKDEYDQAVRTEKTAAAAVTQAKAQLTLAEDDLKHTVITSPVTGRAGVSLYPVGSWLGSSAGTLTTVVTTDPMRLRFAVSMRDLAERFGSAEALREKGRVQLELADGSVYGKEGRVVFTENTAGSDTDTLDVYTEFANPDEKLVAGSTAAAILECAADGSTAAILPSAVMHDSEGAWVWVIRDDLTAEKRRITLGDVTDDAAIVLSGLTVGERVITEGTHKPAEGSAVRIVEGE